MCVESMTLWWKHLGPSSACIQFISSTFVSPFDFSPITQNPSGPVTDALIGPAIRLGATAGQVLFLWVRAKGAIIVTTSSKEERLREYLGIGHLGKYSNRIAT
jgi:diketogulonate reductase-like aldo/keto reductase